MQLSLIVALAENGIIGRDGDLPWHLSADLQRFKRLTMGGAILMGRKTWESIGRPLPGRRSIVISRQSDYHTGFDEVIVTANLDDALSHARSHESAEEEAFVIGGARIYEMCLPRTDRLYVTRVHAEVTGDVTFPEVQWADWQIVSEDSHAADEKNDFSHTYQVWQRKN